jgi:hypothetical protein
LPCRRGRKFNGGVPGPRAPSSIDKLTCAGTLAAHLEGSGLANVIKRQSAATVDDTLYGDTGIGTFVLEAPALASKATDAGSSSSVFNAGATGADFSTSGDRSRCNGTMVGDGDSALEIVEANAVAGTSFDEDAGIVIVSADSTAIIVPGLRRVCCERLACSSGHHRRRRVERPRHRPDRQRLLLGWAPRDPWLRPGSRQSLRECRPAVAEPRGGPRSAAEPARREPLESDALRV